MNYERVFCFGRSEERDQLLYINRLDVGKLPYAEIR